jgi:DNA repair protein RadA
LGHTATFRLYLRKSRGEKRIAILVGSPNRSHGEAVLSVIMEWLKD